MTSTSIQSHFTRYHERFFFLYGKTDDEFCLFPGGILSLEEVLHRHFSDLGYQRILFFNGRRKLYCYDHISKRLCSREGLNTFSPQSGSHPPISLPGKKMCAGPLGMRKVRRQTTASNSEHVSSAMGITKSNDKNSKEDALHFGSMNDLEMVSMIDCCMKDNAVKTAIIFTDGLDFINHTDPGAIRHMAGNLNGWSALFSSNENICLFIMPDMDIKSICDVLNHTPQWQFLLSRMLTTDGQPSKQMVHVGSPRQDEVKRLFHYYRLRNELETDWLTLPQAILSVSRNICTQGASLKSLSMEMKSLTNLNTETLTTISRQQSKKTALERLYRMKGVGPVIHKIEQFVALQKEIEADSQNKESETGNPCPLRLQPPPTQAKEFLNIHLVLTGNPGTGKTTVAYLLGEILRDAGLLKLGHTVKASREDLIAGYVGQTALRTAQKISDAMGGIFFVDEAYRLIQGGENDFGQEALETLMEAMSNHMGAFSTVIAGYPGRIAEFLESNPGLRRRFGSQNIIHIPNFDPPVLQHIFEQEALNNRRTLDPGLHRLLADFFINWHAAVDPETFGNAGDVKNLFQEMDVRRSERVQSSEIDRQSRNTFILEDVPERVREYLRPRKAATVEEALSILDGLTGLAEVKALVRRRTHLIQMQQEQQRRGNSTKMPVPGHYLFLGRPGTGKTTVARLLGRVFQLLGVIGQSQVIEVGPGDLIDKYVGGTEEKARKVFKKALNRVLFIDEAHQLIEGGKNGHGRIVVKALVPFMLNNKKNVCVIAAGYPEDMERFLELDIGLKSRFTKIIMFEDFNETELLEIFTRLVTKNGEIPGPGLLDEVARLFKIWVLDKGKDFGNARDVGKLLEAMMECRAERLTGCDLTACSNEELQTFLPEDLPENERKRMRTGDGRSHI